MFKFHNLVTIIYFVVTRIIYGKADSISDTKDFSRNIKILMKETVNYERMQV